MKRKKERKKYTASKKEPALLLHNYLMICIYTLYQRKKERKKDRKWHVRPAKTQISLGICPVWSEFSLSAWRKFGSLPSHWAHIEDYDQTGRMSRLIRVFARRKDHFVGLVMRRLIYFRRTFVFKLKCSCWKETRGPLVLYRSPDCWGYVKISGYWGNDV